MRMIMKTGLLLVVVSIATLGVVAAQSAGISGTWVGDPGGALMTHELELPAATDATLTLDHWPCVTGQAIAFDLYTPSGMLASSSEASACTQSASFNTGEGGPATLKLYNHLTGVGSWYNLTAEGIDLPGATMMVEEEAAPAEEVMAEEEAMVEDEAVAMAEETEGEEMTEPAEADMAEGEAMVEEAAPMMTSGMLADGATLLGNIGGAQGDYMLDVVEGENYTVTMTYGTSAGGMWPGIGFRVYGPEGLVATGAKPDLFNNDTYSATFTAGETAQYKVQVYNYIHGLMLFYSLEAMASE